VFDDLKGRLKPVRHRTLRRQVLEYIRYTNRIPITQEFVPTEAEQALSDTVSDYLRRPSLQALTRMRRRPLSTSASTMPASMVFPSPTSSARIAPLDNGDLKTKRAAST
jgi:hypothetical protein